MRSVWILLTLTACGGGMSPESVKDVENAARTTAQAYKHQDAEAPESMLTFSAHCAIQSVIRNEKLPPYDGGIPCP